MACDRAVVGATGDAFGYAGLLLRFAEATNNGGHAGLLSALAREAAFACA